MNESKKQKQRNYNLLRTYGITSVEYDQILENQNGVCWICYKPPKNRRLHVDHKHERGEKKKPLKERRPRVRGLLCWSCNAALGKFKDDPVLMRKAADYIEACPAQKVLDEQFRSKEL